MLKRHYNPWQITNSGEKEADKQLSAPGCPDEPIHVIHSLRLSSRYHGTQMAGECDFVVLTADGIMVIEVKGGIIGHGTRPDGSTGFYRMVSRAREPLDNPFIQVDDNADAIQKYLFEKGYRNVFVGKMVCFPECGFSARGIGEDDLWHREHEQHLAEMIIDSLQSQKEYFHDKEREKGASRYIQWEELEEVKMERICSALEPEFNPDLCRSLLKLNLVESDRRKNEGLSLLSGLDENRRLVVQGPPGSGKSSYALSIISRLCRKDGKTGLYLCWNELLGAEMKARISDPALEIPMEKISIHLFFDLACELGELSGDRSLIPSRETVRKGELRNCIKGAIAKTGSKKIMKYDFIVIDEAQDIFDKGIDHVLKAFLKVNNPLQNGSYFIFYDDSQDYPDGGDLGHYIRTRDTLKSYSAVYNLVANLRINTGHGISNLIADAAAGNIDAGKDYGEDVVIRQWERPGDSMTLIRQAVAKEKGINGLNPQDILVLFTSDLLKDEAAMKAVISESADYQLLSSSDYKGNGKIRYTTMLRAKGLESDAVILVCSSLKGKNAFQVFIGASRARCRVHMFYCNR
ncbi:MAG TPA: NERD domain-containing protein [Bacteroidales bacterium]|nr:NERD domain-containing protein [Bacteroidales bacterium]